MIRLTAVSSALILSASVAGAQQGTESSRVHEVRTGDTLWDLANQYLGNPFRWPEIYSINRPQVLDPDLIFPRETILIPGGGPQTVGVASAPPAAIPERTVFFSGESPQPQQQGMTIRTTQAIQVAAVSTGTFYRAGVLMPDSLFRALGKLVSVISPTVVARNTDPQIQPFDRVNVALREDVRLGDRVQFVRPAHLIEPYGRVFLPSGGGIIRGVEGRTATIEVDQFYDRVAPGDFVVAMPVLPQTMSTGRSAYSPTGLVIGFSDDQPIVSTGDMGFVNLGSSSGVSQGDELVAYIPAAEREWGREPEVVVARLQVVRSDPEVSTIRVIALEQPALQAGMPVRPVARGQ